MRKTISFTQEYESEFNHLCKQPDASEYVRRLIRRDISKQEQPIEDRIIKILYQILNSGIKTEKPPENNELRKKSLNSFLNLGKKEG